MARHAYRRVVGACVTWCDLYLCLPPVDGDQSLSAATTAEQQDHIQLEHSRANTSCFCVDIFVHHNAMAAAVCCPVVSNSLQPEQGGPSHQQSHEPINFLYGHLHNSIRTELDNLSTWALSLEADNEQDLLHRLFHLKERYHFLEQVYKYHSSVEDEVNSNMMYSVAKPCILKSPAHSSVPAAGGVPSTGHQGEECNFSIHR